MQHAIDAIYAIMFINPKISGKSKKKRKKQRKDPPTPAQCNPNNVYTQGNQSIEKSQRYQYQYQTCSLTPTVLCDVPPEEVCVTSNVRWIPNPMPNSKSDPSGIVPCVRSALPEDPVSRSSLLFDDPPRQSRVSGSTWLWIVVTVTASLSGRRRFCTAASSSEPSG